MDVKLPSRDHGKRAEWVKRSLEHRLIWYAGWELDGVLRLKLGRRLAGAQPDRVKAELNLMAYCAWRVDADSGPVAGAEERGEDIQSKITQCVEGARIVSVAVTPPSWDAELHMDNGRCLRLFCSHAGGVPVMSINWQFRNMSQVLTVKANSVVTVGCADD